MGVEPGFHCSILDWPALHPGGQSRDRPPIMHMQVKHGLPCPAPLLITVRQASKPSCFATFAATTSR